jgi:hypothetical protein
MARRRSARHTRPSGRGALELAYALLQDDVARVRSERYADHLELIRLTSLVEGLLPLVQRLGAELADLRRELQVARATPQLRDPYVEVLAAEVAELRATVATQQALLSDLTGRLVDVMSRLGPDPWAAHPDAQSPTDTVTGMAPDVAPAYESLASDAPAYDAPQYDPPPYDAPRYGASTYVAPVHEAPPGSYAAAADSAPAYAAAPPPVLPDPVPQPAVYAPAASEAPLDLAVPSPVIADIVPRTSVAPAPAAAYVAPPPAHAAPVATEQLAPPSSEEAEAALDDETVLRLRLIRESFGR